MSWEAVWRGGERGGKRRWVEKPRMVWAGIKWSTITHWWYEQYRLESDFSLSSKVDPSQGVFGFLRGRGWGGRLWRLYLGMVGYGYLRKRFEELVIFFVIHFFGTREKSWGLKINKKVSLKSIKHINHTHSHISPAHWPPQPDRLRVVHQDPVPCGLLHLMEWERVHHHNQVLCNTCTKHDNSPSPHSLYLPFIVISLLPPFLMLLLSTLSSFLSPSSLYLLIILSSSPLPLFLISLLSLS